MVKSSQDLEGVVKVFCYYFRRIQRKNDPEDPNFLRISIIEKFAETLALKSGKLAEKKTEGKEHPAVSNTGQVITALAVASIFVLGVSWLIAHRTSL
ncbi:hypothetical protein N7509_004385 [Penicillium cosmopolitanum]|uniref:Uncharacterized protein n=1 Tax=Penicillium cosmopolitanum TaxID=1131564 RepID=A0A9W9W6S8_9EURO|nr:uncharacterized protein N7509_004385 [Penicillium cosmopolitanum]KAJ5404514.1 hypothetical protein N7509_004385 [Penicillium cosmopolitanum]